MWTDESPLTGNGVTTFLVRNSNSRLPFHYWQIPFDRLFKSGLVEHDRMQRLRKTANFVERTLCDFSDLQQFRAYCESPAQIAHPAEHRANRS